MQNDTRDIRLSVEQIRALLNLLGPMDQITVTPYQAGELYDMLEMTLDEDSETLNDFTA